MIDFIRAALPWIIVGICILVFLIHQNSKRYQYEGMFMGMSLGCALGSIYRHLSIGLTLGMIIGLALGSCIQKKE